MCSIAEIILSSLFYLLQCLCVNGYKLNNNSIPISKHLLKKLMFLATKAIFMLNKHFDKQVKGIMLSNPLRPAINNFFMTHSKETIFAEKFDGSLLSKLYLRDLDDVYTIFDSNQNYNSSFFRF